MALDAEATVRITVDLLTGVLYTIVGVVILRRETAPEANLANRLFATWWFGLAFLYTTLVPFNFAYASGWRDLTFAVAYVNLLLVVVAVASWGLIGFLLYIYTGSTRWVVPAGAFYAAVAFGLLWLVSWLEPTGFAAGSTLRFVYARQLASGFTLGLGLLLSGPLFLAALAYATLVVRVRDRGPRFRIAMVAGGFMLQFGWAIVRSVLGLQRKYPDSVVLLATNQAIVILVSIAVLFAYRPPAWLRARLGLPEAGG